MAERQFGEIAGIRFGTIFEDRQALSVALVHRPTQAGISGSGAEGADSIVVSGGYEDDVDAGDEHLDALLRRDPRRAKVEILKHLDGDLVIQPRPSSPGERRAEISGRAKGDSLLRDQEAVCLQVVAGAGFEPATFGL
jgi:SAD/SRA domain